MTDEGGQGLGPMACCRVEPEGEESVPGHSLDSRAVSGPKVASGYILMAGAGLVGLRVGQV